jgi:two-component system LytT family sensor kinase
MQKPIVCFTNGSQRYWSLVKNTNDGDRARNDVNFNNNPNQRSILVNSRHLKCITSAKHIRDKPFLCLRMTRPRTPLRNRIFQHAAFWLCIYLFDVLLFGFDSERYGFFFGIVLLEMPGMMVLAYFIMYWAIPKFLERQYVQMALAMAAVFLACSFVVHIFFIMVSYYAENIGLWNVSKILIRGFYLFANAAIAVIIKLTLLWFNNQRRVMEMESTRLEAELKMLREQVNPHFLFNTLNNLYGLTEKSPAKAREMIAGLSRILHFMLHESNQRVVSLREEIDSINDYINLERVRYDNGLSVSVNIDPQCEDLRIAPLILFPFVENSFKHGASETIGSSWINIDFSTFKENFIFKVENSKPAPGTASQNGHGIGLTNTRRRLELLYPGEHSIQILDTVDTYLVIVKIRMSKLREPAANANEVQVPHR